MLLRTRAYGWLRLTIFTLALGFVASPLFGQLPATRLAAVFPAGGKAGETVEITISGADLDDVDRLMFSHPNITAARKMAEPGPFDSGPQPVPEQFVVTIGGNVPAGAYEVRALGKYGLSNPRRFLVDDLPEAREVEPNGQLETASELSLPALANGQCDPATDVDFFRFQARSGQRILASVRARQIDSPLDSVLTVYDSAGRQLGSSRDGYALDSVIDFTAPADGEYSLKIHDSAYRGGPEYVYRVAIGVLPHIDFIFPPAAAASGNRGFTVYGRNLPGGQPANLQVEGRPLEQLAVTIPLPAPQTLQAGSLRLDPAAAGLDVVEYRVKGPHGASNPFPVGLATAPAVEEAAANDSSAQAQTLTVPCEVMGRFYPRRDRDWYQFEARKDQSFSIEVVSQRLGRPSNPGLLVQRVVKPAEGDQPEQVQQLAYVTESTAADGGAEFDTRHDDPVHRFTAPADGIYRLMVHDSFADVEADPRATYRLIVHHGQPDFRLAAIPEQSSSAVLLRKGGQAAIRVVAFRQDGFDGEIQVSASGLPAGVSCQDAIIGPASDHAMLVLTAADNAAAASGLVQVVGKARLGSAEVTRTARFGTALAPTTVRAAANQALPPVEGRLADDLAVSVSAGETAPVTLQAGGGKVWEVSRAAQLKIPYSRGGEFKGNISIVPRGLPPNVTAPNANLPGNNPTGEFQVNLTANTPTGTYTFYLDGIAVQVDYARNPEAAAAAAERKKEVDQIKAQADAESKAAAAAKAEADKAAAAATAALNAARTAKQAADKLLADSQAAAKSAAEQAAQAQAAAVASPEDANRKAAAEAARKNAEAAAEEVKKAQLKTEEAAKSLANAETQAKLAEEARQEAEQKATQAAERAQQATQLKTQTDQQATALANAAKPKKLNVPIVSTPITLKITPAPITLAEFPKVGPLKQGEKIEVPVNINRLYEYTAQASLTTALPSGVTGISIPNASVPANQNQAKLTIQAAANATEGEHELTVRATVNLNGQNLVVEQPLRLVVVKAPPAT